MKTTFRSCLVLTGLSALWAPFFSALGLCQTTNADDRLRVGVYPVIVGSSSPQPGRLAPAADSVFVRLARHLSPLLASALQEENLNVLPPEVFSDFLQSRPAFDPFHADSVRKLCAAFTVQKLVLPIISISPESSSTLHLRLILRWLDGASGEVTKSHVSAYELPRVAGAAFTAVDAKKSLHALLNGPELIISQDETVAPLPLPLLPEPVLTNQKPRKWWWYLSAAAVIGGGSAYWFLGREGAADEPRLLPEPPDPPPR